MFQRLATQIQSQLPALAAQYTAQLRTVPGYANLPEAACHDLAQHMLHCLAECLTAGDDQQLRQYSHEHAQQALTYGFQPEWIQLAVGIPQAIITPLLETADESNFVWRALSHAQAAAWMIFSREQHPTAEQPAQTPRQLQAALEATSELIQIQDLDTLYRRTVELAREKFDVERCGLYIVDESREKMWGTYGTDDQRQTTDERGAQRTTAEYADILAASPQQMWGVRETPHSYTEAGQQHIMGAGWVVGTVLRGASGPIGIFFNDRALSGYPVDVAQQETLAIYCSIVGLIIERKRAEEVRRENEEKFKAIYEGSNDAVMLLSEQGFFACNPRTLDMFGFQTEAEFTAVHPSDVSPLTQPDGRDSLSASLEQIQTAYQQGYAHFEWVHRRANGEDFPAEVLLSAFDLNGRRVLQATVRDIAERKRAEEALRASQQLLQTVMDNIPQAIFWKDRQLVYLGCNRAFADDAGLASPADVIGKTDWDMPWKDQAELYRADDQLVIEQGATKLGYEEPQTTPDGATIWLSTSKIPMRDSAGNVAAVLGMYEDITARKQLEQQIRESLARRERQVQTGTEVSQEVAAATDLAELFQRVVTLTKDRFNYYHTQLFRYEPAQEAVVLITGYGEIGQQMLATGHQLPMGRGVVGTAAATGESILASDVRQDPDWQPNPYLPDTRGELAVPIKWRDEVLGILDVQSDRAHALTDEDRLLLEGLCGQIASALESTRLLEQLRQNETQLSEALRIAQLANWEYDVLTDTFTFNDQFYALLRTTAKQEGGYTMSSAQYAQRFVHPEDAPLVGREVQLSIETTDPNFSRQLDHRIFYADGEMGYFTVRFRIEKDAQGRTVKTYGANQDITERKLAEQEFSRFKQGLEQASDAVFMTDVAGQITYVNPAFERIYGYTRAEVLGQTPRLLKSGQLSQEYYQNFWRTLLNKQSVSGEKPNKTKDGRVIVVEDSNSPILDSSGALLGFLSTHRDITERKQAEQRIAETLQETERLYAAVSHESWQAYRQTGQLSEGYVFDQALIQPADDVWEPEIAQALTQHALITSYSERRAVAVSPISVRSETIGALGVYDDPTQPLSQEDLQLIAAVSEQVALALESARLFDQSQRDAEREYTINRVTSRIRNARSVDEVLGIAAQELRLATHASRSVVEILPDTDQPARAGNGEGVKA